MIDQSKRRTLKSLAVGASAIAGGSLTMNSAAFAAPVSMTDAARTVSLEDIELGSIDVYTRVSVANNDLEVVLTNAGKQPVNITQMTPAVTRVARGEFDFSALVKDGPLRMYVGESVTIPLKRKALAYTTSSSATPSLNKSLKETLSIITDDTAYASVSILS